MSYHPGDEADAPLPVGSCRLDDYEPDGRYYVMRDEISDSLREPIYRVHEIRNEAYRSPPLSLGAAQREAERLNAQAR